MNSQLVRGAARAADKFNDLGKAVNDGAGPGVNHQALANQRKAQARADEAKVEGYMNRVPADFDVSQIPQKYRENISTFLQEGKKKYADAAMNIGDYEAGSEGYMKMVSDMNTVKNSFHNLKDQFTQFGANKKDLSTDMLEGMYSKGNNPDEISFLTSVYTDERDVSIGEDGNIGFIGDDGVTTNLGDMPDYFNKDYKNGDAIMSMANGIYSSGQPLNSSTSLMYENKLYGMIEKGGLSTLKSLARDDFFNRGGIDSITDEELNDPEQRDAVEKKLVDYYMGVFKTHASNGASARQTSSGSGGNKGTDSYKKDKARYDLYKEYTDKGEIPPLPSNFQVRPETDAAGNELKTPTGKMEILGTGGNSQLIDLSTAAGKKAFYVFIGIRPDVFGSDDFIEPEVDEMIIK